VNVFDEIMGRYERALGIEKRCLPDLHDRCHAPTLSDFVCDVELTAKRVLTKEQFRFFRVYHLAALTSKRKREFSRAYREMDNEVRYALTTEWTGPRCKIYPFWLYFGWSKVRWELPRMELPICIWTPTLGRPRKYKTNAERQAAYRARKCVA